MAVSATLVSSTSYASATSFASVAGGSAFSDRVLFGFINSYDSNFWPLYPITIGGISAVRQDVMTAAAVVPTGTTHTWAATGATDANMLGVWSLSGGANPRPAYCSYYYDTTGTDFVVDIPVTAGSTIIAQITDLGGSGVAPGIVSGMSVDFTHNNTYTFAHSDQASAGTVSITVHPTSGATSCQFYVFDTAGPDWQFIGLTAPVSANSGNLNLGGEPSGSAQDDILIANIAYRSNAAFTVPSGWNSAASSNTGNTSTTASGAIPSGHLAYAIRGASAPASFTFTRTGGSFAMGRIMTYRHKNAGTPSFDTAVATVSGSAGYAVTGSAMTVANAGSLIFAGLLTTPYGGYSTGLVGTNTTPKALGFADFNTWSGDNGSSVGAAGSEYWSNMTASGSTGTFSGTIGATISSYGLMMTAAFAPPTGGGGLTASLFTDTDTFFSPTVVGPRVLSPSLFSDTDSFFTPTVVRQPIFGELLGTLQANNNTIPTNFAATGSVPVSVGDLIVSLTCQQTTLTVTGVTDNLSNSYTAQNAGTDAGAVTGRVFYSIATNAGTLTSVTAACTTSANDGVHIVQVIKGPFSSIDANPANITSDITSAFTCPSTGTLAQADEVVIGWGVANYGTSWSTSSPSTQALQLANSTTIKAAMSYRLVSATTAVAPAFTAASNPTQTVLGTLSFRKNLTQALTASLFSDTDTFFGPTVSQSGQSLTASLFTDTDSFFSATITTGAVGLTASLFTDTDTFFNATVSQGGALQNLTAPLFSDTDSFFTATVSSSYPLTASLFSDTDSFFSATVTRGAVTLAPSLFTDTDTFFGPTVSQGYTTVYSASPALTTNNSNPNLNFRQFVQLSANSNGSLRFTFKAGTTAGGGGGGLGVVGASYGKWDGVAVNSAVADMAHTPLRLTFGGSNGGSAAQDGELTSDLVAHPGVTLNSGDWVIVAWQATSAGNQIYSNGHTTALCMFNVSSGDYSQYQTVAATGLSWSESGSAGQPGNAGGRNFSVSLGETSAGSTTQALTAPLYSDTDTFFAATVTRGAVGLTAALFSETDTFFSATVASAYTVAPALFTDSDSFFSATVAPGTVTLTPGLFADADSFFSPAITGSYALTAPLFTDTDTFFSATVAASQALTAPLFTDSDAFFTAVVTTSNTLVPPLYADTDSFFSATITGSYTLTAPLFTDADAFFAAAVTQSQALTAALFTDTDTFFTPVITVGGVTLTASLFTETDLFHSAVVSSGSALLAPDPFTDNDVFFSATVTPDNELFAGLFVDTDTFFSVTVAAGSLTLTPGLFTDTDAFFAASALNVNALATPLLTDNDTFFAATVTSTKTLAPALFVDTDTFFSALVERGQIRPDLFTDADVFFTPVITTGPVTIAPSLFVDQDFFQSPVATIVFGRGVGGTSVAPGRRDPRLKPGLQQLKPRPPAPKKKERELPEWHPESQPEPEAITPAELETLAEVVDPRLMPQLDALSQMRAAIAAAERERIQQMQDDADIAEVLALLDGNEQDEADVSDVLALLDSL